jgi:hypothetical protein
MYGKWTVKFFIIARVPNHMGKKHVLNGRSEGKIEETNVNFIQKMYGN